MRGHLLALSIGGILATAQHQVPLSGGPLAPPDHTKKLAFEWNRYPDPDETGHLIFNSVSGLLDHWHNAYCRNGHSIVPATIAPGTLLYHGRRQANTPPDGPEWVSFDPEHSCIFGRNVYTFIVGSEPLKVLYLDGSSAAKLKSGTMDTQEILWRGEVRDGGWWDKEPNEIVELCNWGKDYDIHGFVRMEFDFEIMLCNFTQGVSLVSGLTLLPIHRDRGGHGGLPPPPGRERGNLAPGPPTGDDPLALLVEGHSRFDTPPNDRLEPPRPPKMPPGGPWEEPTPPKGWKGSLLPGSSASFGAMEAGNWHNNRLNGVVLDHAGTISFFNPKYTSLVEARRGVDWMKWRVGNITKSDVELFRTELNDVLTRKEKGSHVRWDGLLRSVIERHADRLEFLSEWLGADRKNVTEGIVYARRTVLEMLFPYFVVDTIPSDYKTNSTWLSPTMHYCSTAYTSHLPVKHFTPQEHMLQGAIEVVTKEICRTLGVIWLDAFDAEATQNNAEQQNMLKRWKGEVDRLMEWLGWTVWVKCKPACGPFELCNVPQWPFGMRPGDSNDEDDITPRCMSRIEQ